MVEQVEQQFSEAAEAGENFNTFRDRMVGKAISDDLGILAYHIDGKVYPPDYRPEANDGIGLGAWSEMICDFRFKGLS